MRRALLTATVAATLALVGCNNGRPTTAPAPEDNAAPVIGPTCGDWIAGTPAHTTATIRQLTAEPLDPANAAKVSTGLDRYCHAYPDDDLVKAATGVVTCLWPDDVQRLRRADCAMVLGEGQR